MNWCTSLEIISLSIPVWIAIGFLSSTFLPLLKLTKFLFQFYLKGFIVDVPIKSEVFAEVLPNHSCRALYQVKKNYKTLYSFW